MVEPTRPDALQKQQPYGNQGERAPGPGAAKESPAGDRDEQSGVNQRDEEDARGVPGVGTPPPA